MILDILKRLMQMILLLALQVLLFNHIVLLGYATPLVYVAFMLYVPLNANRVGTLVWAFVLGTLVDMFSNTPGVSAFSLTFVAMIQPNLLRLYTPKDAVEDMNPNYKTMGTWNHLRYMTILLLVHHVIYFVLESFSFFNLHDMLIAFGLSFVVSWILIAVIELLRK